MTRLLLILPCLLLAVAVSADSFRCGRMIVTSGESTNALIRKCGQPSRKYNSKTVISDQGLQKRVGVSSWVYERRGKKDMIVSVHNGVVAKIEVD